jgi:hypothetical protein
MRELMPEDEDKLERIDNMVSEMYRSLKGDSFNREKGLIERFYEFEERLDEMEKGYKKLYTLLIGIAIGIGLGGVVFGAWTLRAFIDVVK